MPTHSYTAGKHLSVGALVLGLLVCSGLSGELVQAEVGSKGSLAV